jgi:hypothetical protein
MAPAPSVNFSPGQAVTPLWHIPEPYTNLCILPFTWFVLARAVTKISWFKDHKGVVDTQKKVVPVMGTIELGSGSLDKSLTLYFECLKP